MAVLLGSLPVVVAVLIAAFLPFDALPAGAAQAFHAGGWGMRLILFAFLVSLWLIIDRAWTMLRSALNAEAFLEQLRLRFLGGDVAAAYQYCQQVDKPLARIVGSGLAQAGQGEARVLRAMDESAYVEVPLIERRTGYLALMGNVATLMGLFGTIVGLIKSFGAVGTQSGAGASAGSNATQLAAGISEAMNCTAFGLLTGILALLAFSILNGRTQAIIDEINLFSHRAFRLWKRAQQRAEGERAAWVRKPIHEPHPHLMTHLGLLKAKGHHGHGGRKNTFASLQLTPLIDMFIVMVIFLLMSFSASGEILSASKDIKVPFAKEITKLERVPVVAISYPEDDPAGGIITLEGREVATAREVAEDTGPDWKIAALTERLEAMKEGWSVTNPDSPFKGELILQVDKNIDFVLIKKVMYSAGIAGYRNLFFAVQERSSQSGAEGG